MERSIHRSVIERHNICSRVSRIVVLCYIKHKLECGLAPTFEPHHVALVMNYSTVPRVSCTLSIRRDILHVTI